MTESFRTNRSANRAGWAAGRTFGERYVAERLIGEGGWAETYLGRDQLLGRAVALKLLRSQFAGDPALVDRFEREARIAAAISHPNVVAVYDFGTEGETFFIALQYIAGSDLKRYVTEHGRLPLGDAVEIATEILKGLGAIHRAGIVHRDVKPQNVLLGDDGLVRITDFGVAHQSLATRVTSHGAALGTAAYMAPEQAKGAAVSPATDLYALGVVLYELLTGRLPFERDNPMATLLAHVQELPPPMQAMALDADVPPAVEAVVARALEKEPEARFASAPEMLAALAQASGSRAGWTPTQHFAAADLTTRVNPPIGGTPGGGFPPSAVPPAATGGRLPPSGGRAVASDSAGSSGRGWILALLAVGVAIAALVAIVLADPWGGDDDPSGSGNQGQAAPSATTGATLPVLAPIQTATASATAEPTETVRAQPSIQARPTSTQTPAPTQTPEPTETPPPTATATANPTETATAEPTATEEVEPTEPPPTSTPEIVEQPPEDQGAIQPGDSVIYDASAWEGGARKKKDKGNGGSDSEIEVASVEANGGPKSTATLSFNLSEVPAEGVTISIQARREKEDDETAVLMLQVNEAAAPEPLDISAAGENWGTVQISVPADALVVGANQLTVTAERSGQGKPPTILLGEVTIDAGQLVDGSPGSETPVDGIVETEGEGDDEAPTISPT